MKIVKPNSKYKIRKFANQLGIDLNHAKFVEYMRNSYVAWEHDYVKQEKSPQEEEVIETS